MMGALLALAALAVLAFASKGKTAAPVNPTPPPGPYLELRARPGAGIVAAGAVDAMDVIVGVASTAPQTLWSVGVLPSDAQVGRVLSSGTADNVAQNTIAMLQAFAQETTAQPVGGFVETDRGRVTLIVSPDPSSNGWVWTTSEGLIGEAQERGTAITRAVRAAQVGGVQTQPPVPTPDPPPPDAVGSQE